MNVAFNPTLLPGGYLANQQFYTPPRQTQPMMQGTTMPSAYSYIGQDPFQGGESSAGAALSKIA
jgi:hypothetical protein